MPSPKPSADVSGTEGSGGRDRNRLFAADILEERKKLDERARNRLEEIEQRKRELLAPLEEEEQQLRALLGQVEKVQRRHAGTSVRSGLRNYVREAMKAGKKMRMAEIRNAVEALGYEPKPGGTYKALDQALRAMEVKGEVIHHKAEKLWQLSEGAGPKGKKKG